MIRTLAPFFIQLLLGVDWFVQVDAHGKLTVPVSRNVIDGNGGCAHCLNGAGPCGSSKFLDYYAGPQATWQAGSVVPITITVTAHHRGHYEIRVCDRQLNSSVSNPDDCLNKWVLERATPEEAGITDCQPGDSRPACVPLDPRHPERFYLPPSTEISGTHTYYVKVPSDLQCDVCTIQWHWWSANSCIPASDYGCYRDVLQSNGYWAGSKAAWWTVGPGACPGGCGSRLHCGCGEQFWNCADITVQGSSGRIPTTKPTPTPTLALATPAPTSVSQPEPEPEPETEPSPAPGLRCLPTNYAYSLYCENEASAGLCPEPWCERMSETPTPLPTDLPAARCLPLGECEGWCDQSAYEAWCEAQGQAGQCSSLWCKSVSSTAASLLTSAHRIKRRFRGVALIQGNVSVDRVEVCAFPKSEL